MLIFFLDKFFVLFDPDMRRCVFLWALGHSESMTQPLDPNDMVGGTWILRRHAYLSSEQPSWVGGACGSCELQDYILLVKAAGQTLDKMSGILKIG